MSEIDAMKVVADVLEKLESDERARVLAWAQSKFGGTSAATPYTNARQVPAGVPSRVSKSKGARKAKTSFTMDKTLNFSPQGKLSAVQFVAAKSPSNGQEKCTVAVYYLRDFVDLQKVTLQTTYTFFKSVQWPVPADLRNVLHKAGSSGWLDTADSENIKLTSLGENLVEHTLPARQRA